MERPMGENMTKIVRFDRIITLPNGEKSNMWCVGGTEVEVRKIAEAYGKEHGAEVAAVV